MEVQIAAGCQEGRRGNLLPTRAPTQQNSVMEFFQAFCAFCALHGRKLRGVSGSLHPHDGNCRQSQAVCMFVRSTHENWGTSKAVCLVL